MTADVPPSVLRAARLSAGDHSGIVGYRILQRTTIDGGPVQRREEVELATVFDGPTLVKIRVLRHVTNGSVANDADNSALASKLERAAGPDGFAVPFDRQNLTAYTYAVDGAVVRFYGKKIDSAHPNGEFTVDPAGHVTEMTYAPRELPRYAKRGSITVWRAEVLPGFWASVHETQTYGGSLGFIKGSALVDVRQSHFRRYTTVRAAEAELAATPI